MRTLEFLPPFKFFVGIGNGKAEVIYSRLIFVSFPFFFLLKERSMTQCKGASTLLNDQIPFFRSCRKKIMTK